LKRNVAPKARMHRDGVTTVLIEHFQPSKYLLRVLATK